jgi:type I restriction enzyme M protein
MANPPFNVDKVKAESASAAGRPPFGLPGVNQKTKEIGNANYLWISYFYAYLNDHGRAGFVMASSATDSANKDRDIREKLVRTGDVDVMVSVGNNFFYTLSLPCSLWFFDRNKHADIRDKVLFIDARNYYTVVDRTLNEWTEWQLRNLQAIVHLYRGEKEKYQSLIRDYIEILDNVSAPLTQERLEEVIKNGEKEYSTRFADCLEREKKQAKEAIASATRKEKKQVEAEWKETIEHWEDLVETARQFEWLTEKFGDGEYRDILGLCKIATIQEIAEKNYSLTPGAYVGVAEQEDDGVDFHERMNEIHAELAQLNQEANVLMDEIQKAWKGLK